ncbi:MAG TPA: pyruvate dehydrogenase (acetyl-transferring) E1 component subunit alpha, partial [Tepidisphaeraceae bacterium]
MARRTVYQAEIEFLQMLDESGRLDPEETPELSDEEARSLYEQMVLCREFDEQAFKLQRSGRMGTFPQNKGEEAVALGAAKALTKGVDHIVPYYRENPALFLHGLPMHYILLHWMGDERGNAIRPELAMNPISVAIGTQTLHATGIAWAFKLRKEPRVVLAFFGDGATSTGDFHAAMNFAGVMKLPCVFCCVNNGWAISVPVEKQTAAQTLAQKALGYGMPAMQVDGNDIFAVHSAVKEAVEFAREGGGPSFIEAMTYRIGDHTTADDASRYRDPEKHAACCAGDPLIRTRKYLESKQLWDEQKQAAAEERARVIVQDVVHAAMNIEPPAVSDLFDHTFAELPEELIRQRDTLRTDSLGQDPQQEGLQEKAHVGS